MAILDSDDFANLNDWTIHATGAGSSIVAVSNRMALTQFAADRGFLKTYTTRNVSVTAATDDLIHFTFQMSSGSDQCIIGVTTTDTNIFAGLYFSFNEIFRNNNGTSVNTGIVYDASLYYIQFEFNADGTINYGLNTTGFDDPYTDLGTSNLGQTTDFTLHPAHMEVYIDCGAAFFTTYVGEYTWSNDVQPNTTDTGAEALMLDILK